jgi:hypothetical protein
VGLRPEREPAGGAMGESEMMKRRWLALVMLLALPAGLGAFVERPIPDLSGRWCACIRAMATYPDGHREFFQMQSDLYIYQDGQDGSFYFTDLDFSFSGMVGHRYVFGADSYSDYEYDYSYVLLMDLRIGMDRFGRRSLTGYLTDFEQEYSDASIVLFEVEAHECPSSRD